MTMDEVVPIVPREARPYQGRRAGLVTRLIAGVIDGVLVVVSLLVGYVGVNGLIFLFDPRGFQFSEASPILSVAAGLVLLVLYLTVAWSTIGRTYGCQVMGLRVVSRRGGPRTADVGHLRLAASSPVTGDHLLRPVSTTPRAVTATGPAPKLAGRPRCVGRRSACAGCSARGCGPC